MRKKNSWSVHPIGALPDATAGYGTTAVSILPLTGGAAASHDDPMAAHAVAHKDEGDGRARGDSGARPIIAAVGLTRIYGIGAGRVTGINAIDLSVCDGELVVLKGNSGSGKSTLLALLAGLDQPTSGQLTVAGHDLRHASVRELTLYRREIVGMVFQAFNLLPTLTVLENVCLPALLAGKPYPGVRARGVEWLRWLHLDARRDHYPAQLSGGEMQRTAIARALINDPRIILADEPTGNLDSQNGQVVMELLAELNRQSGRTVVIATHSVLADPFASLRIELKDGAIVTMERVAAVC
jgi:ABC-type lipoprotein export system ATPase subunit